MSGSQVQVTVTWSEKSRTISLAVVSGIDHCTISYSAPGGSSSNPRSSAPSLTNSVSVYRLCGAAFAEIRNP